MSIAFASQTNAEASAQATTSAGASVIAEKVDEEAKQTDPELEQKNLFPVTVQTLIFQAVMVLTSLYCGMLFTNWGDAVIGGEKDDYFTSALFSAWVKISALWFTILLFTVSVTLTICCPNRIL
jgi:hypothetical protein